MFPKGLGCKPDLPGPQAPGSGISWLSWEGRGLLPVEATALAVQEAGEGSLLIAAHQRPSSLSRVNECCAYPARTGVQCPTLPPS